MSQTSSTHKLHVLTGCLCMLYVVCTHVLCTYYVEEGLGRNINVVRCIRRGRSVVSLSLQQQYLPTHSAICRRPRHMNKGFGRQSAGNQDHTTSSTVAECSKQGRNASTSSSLYLLLSSRAAYSTSAVVEELNWE